MVQFGKSWIIKLQAHFSGNHLLYSKSSYSSMWSLHVLILNSYLITLQLYGFLLRAVPPFDSDLTTVYYELIQRVSNGFVARIIQHNIAKNIKRIFDPAIGYSVIGSLLVSNNYIFCLVRYLIVWIFWELITEWSDVDSLSVVIM